jgi:hypothetical protein
MAYSGEATKFTAEESAMLKAMMHVNFAEPNRQEAGQKYREHTSGSSRRTAVCRRLCWKQK